MRAPLSGDHMTASPPPIAPSATSNSFEPHPFNPVALLAEASDAVYTPSCNREGWLLQAVDRLRPRFEEVGSPLPKLIRVSISFPTGGGRVIGQDHQVQEMWGSSSHHIFITPAISKSEEVLAVLVHELCHAASPEPGHGKHFGRLARTFGLVGNLTSTTAGVELLAQLRLMSEALGPYPHRRLNPTSNPKKQSTRMIKVVCPCCGYLVRTTGKWLEVGLPICPFGTEMERADLT